MIIRGPMKTPKRRLLRTAQVLNAGASIISFLQSVRLLSSDVTDWRGFAWFAGFGILVGVFVVMRSLLSYTITQRGREQFDSRRQSVEVFYPVPFESSPYLRITRVSYNKTKLGKIIVPNEYSVRGQYVIADQTEKGFVLKKAPLRFSWKAKGVPSFGSKSASDIQ